jgi:hypothetical protein
VLEQARMCLWCCLLQGVRHSPLRTNTVLHLVRPLSHYHRVVLTQMWARGLDKTHNMRKSQVAQQAAQGCLYLGGTDAEFWIYVRQLIRRRYPGGPVCWQGQRHSMWRTDDREGQSDGISPCFGSQHTLTAGLWWSNSRAACPSSVVSSVGRRVARPAIASCGQDIRGETIRGRKVLAHHGSVCSFHLDVFSILLSTANSGLHPTVLDLVMVVSYYRVELTWSLPL